MPFWGRPNNVYLDRNALQNLNHASTGGTVARGKCAGVLEPSAETQDRPSYNFALVVIPKQFYAVRPARRESDYLQAGETSATEGQRRVLNPNVRNCRLVVQQNRNMFASRRRTMTSLLVR
jgi:hypothetical protein